MPRLNTLLAGLLVFAACSSSGRAGTTSTTPSAATPTTAPTTAAAVTTDPEPTTDAATIPSTTVAPTSSTIDPTIARPFTVFVPSTYSAATPMPLVLLLHGFSVPGDVQEAYFKLQPEAESRGFLYVHPDGTDGTGGQFWNATDACCGFGRDVEH